MDDNGLQYIARAIGLQNPTPQQLAAGLRAKEMTHTPLPPLETLRGKDPLTDWALGMQDRALHPLQTAADYSQQFQNMTPLEQGMQLVGGGMAGATAWHGSPHLFDKFKSEAIGTGEGAQAYGHGLYLAQKKAVAEDYARKLSGDADLKSLEWGNLPQAREGSMADKLAQKFGYDGQNFRDEDGKFITEYAKEQGAVKHTVNKLDYHVFPDQSYIVDAGKGWDFGQRGEQQLYKTDIPDSHIDKMLDWDKPLSEQPYALKALKDAGYGRTDTPGITGAYFAPKTPEEGMALHAAGIPGIKYLDGSSRTAGEGTRNFVMFNPDDIKILERNGQPTGQQPWGKQ